MGQPQHIAGPRYFADSYRGCFETPPIYDVGSLILRSGSHGELRPGSFNPELVHATPERARVET